MSREWLVTRQLSRRELLAAGAIFTTGAIGGLAGCRRDLRPRVCVARAASYAVDLEPILRAALTEIGITPAAVAGKRILLKPNLVETALGAGHINTHPDVVRAAARVLRGFGAAEVLVGEGPGHRRDTILVLEESGLAQVLVDEKLRFVDLNRQRGFAVAQRRSALGLVRLTLPVVLANVDWIVSLAKLKTHHWAGATLAMKNLFGLMPGSYYGWPKNVLHYAGLQESILDINATVRPQFAIVDGIVGMEGDGPILGTAKTAGVLVVGTNLPAVDATAARVMGIDPLRIRYLAEAAGWLGPIAEKAIHQVGETLASVRTPFELVEKIPAHKALLDQESGAGYCAQGSVEAHALLGVLSGPYSLSLGVLALRSALRAHGSPQVQRPLVGTAEREEETNCSRRCSGAREDGDEASCFHLWTPQPYFPSAETATIDAAPGRDLAGDQNSMRKREPAALGSTVRRKFRPALVQLPDCAACHPLARSFGLSAAETVATEAGVAKTTTAPPSGREVKSTRLEGR